MRRPDLLFVCVKMCRYLIYHMFNMSDIEPSAIIDVK